MTSLFTDNKIMPALFLGHGNPMNAIEENQFVEGFRGIAKTLPSPKAILCISAHWYINGTKVTAMEIPRTIYDFYGFPEELYNVQYPANGDPDLAAEIIELLNPVSVEPDLEWGLDHGAWSVLKHLYPLADIPVVQLSIDRSKPAEFHYQLGQKLKPLRTKGVLIVGSGNIVHNLHLIDFGNMDKDDYGFDWAVEAKQIINKLILSGQTEGLINYKELGKSVQIAIPTPDHYLPLLYILGLQNSDESFTIFNDKLAAGSLSMTSFKIG